MRITEYTGVGGAAGQVFFYKILDHKITKFFPYVEYIMCKAMLHRCLPRIVEGIKITTACFFLAVTAGHIVPCFHGDADHFVAFGIEHQGCNGTVDTAAHGHQHFSFLTHSR